ncbi:MAG TPA: DUF4013 domain-containing protein [Pirellulaceae bacterium]|nr:DUF4013 domain-containing protein [Pirellulaceae bacterium]
MSHADPQNPYQSPQAYPPAAASAMPPPAHKLEKLEYLRAYNYIFENPEWTTVLLWGALMALLPVVGPLVLLGYIFVVIDALLESKGTRYPVLDLNRFVDYLVRGLWPFLASLVVAVLLIPIYFVAWLVIMVGMMIAHQAGGEDAAGVAMLILMPIMFLIEIVLILGLNIITLPLMLRAGLAQDFAEAFKFDWIKDFVRKMWLDTLLAMLFMTVTSMALVLVGYLACCIGVFFVQPIVMLAYAHFLYQLYAIYLTRGGQPVFAKPKLPSHV